MAMVGVPVMVIAAENPQAYTFLLSAIIFVMCLSLEVFLFYPKIRFHMSKNKLSMKESIGGMSEVNKQSSQFEMKRYSSQLTTDSSIPVEPEAEEAGLEDFGIIKVIDTPAIREEMKTENAKLLKKVKGYERRISLLEKNLGESSPVLQVDEAVIDSAESNTIDDV